MAIADYCIASDEAVQLDHVLAGQSGSEPPGYFDSVKFGYVLTTGANPAERILQSHREVTGKAVNLGTPMLDWILIANTEFSTLLEAADFRGTSGMPCCSLQNTIRPILSIENRVTLRYFGYLEFGDGVQPFSATANILDNSHFPL